MSHTRVAKQGPVAALDRRLVTHHQRRQHTGAARVLHTRSDAAGDPLARGFDRVAAAGPEEQRRRVARAIAQVAGGADALLPEPALAVEALGVGGTVRTLETHRQPPGVARAPGASRPPTPEVADQQPWRQVHRLAVPRRRFDGELEAVVVGAALGHGGHLPGDHQVHAFQTGGQRLRLVARSAQARCSGRRERTRQQGGAQRKPGTSPGPDPCSNAGQQERRRQQPRVPRHRPQPGLQQLQGHAQHSTGQHRPQRVHQPACQRAVRRGAGLASFCRTRAAARPGSVFIVCDSLLKVTPAWPSMSP